MQTELLKVTGMTCGGCIGNVTHALKAIPGVGDVKVSLSAGEATVQYDERLTLPDRLKSAVKASRQGRLLRLARADIYRRNRQSTV